MFFLIKIINEICYQRLNWPSFSFRVMARRSSSEPLTMHALDPVPQWDNGQNPKQYTTSCINECCLGYTLGKRLLRPQLRKLDFDMDRIFVLPVDSNWHEMYLWLLPNEIHPNLGQTFTSMPSGIIKVPNHSLGGHSPKSAFALRQVRINRCMFLSILTDCSNNAPSNPNRYKAWSACTCQWGHAAKCYCWSWGSNSCCHKPKPPKTCCHWNFSARKVPGSSSENHTPPIPCFVEGGLTGLLHKWNFDGMRAGGKTINNQLLSHGYHA